LARAACAAVNNQADFSAALLLLKEIFLAQRSRGGGDYRPRRGLRLAGVLPLAFVELMPEARALLVMG
jgi:hypothetical protein